MSNTNLPDFGTPPASIPADTRKWLIRLGEHVRELRGYTGDATGVAGSGSGTGGTPVAGPPGPQGPAGPPGDPDPYVPDATPPPTPSGVTVTAGLSAIYVKTDQPLFLQGHGYARTLVYGAKYPGTGPLPTFGSATLQHEFVGEVGSFPSDLGTQWHIWVKWLTVDGVESAVPAGGTNGYQVTTGKIGTADLGPLIVEAGNLATGAVTATKLAAGAVGLTAFAAGLEPVSVVGTLPSPGGYTGPRTVFLTTDGKLYRFIGGAWVATVPAADIAGLITDAQIAAIAAAKLTGQITSTQITDGAISTPKLAAGAVTAANIAADTITAAQIAANAITAAELSAGAVTAGKIAANAVTAGTIAAGAVSASQIVAGAITTDKLLVTGRGAALNDDPAFKDSTAWLRENGSAGIFTTVTDGYAGLNVLRSGTPGAAGSWYNATPRVPFDPSKTYRVRGLVRRSAGSDGRLYLGVALFDSTGANIPGDGSQWFYGAASNVFPSTAWTPFSATFGAGTARPFPGTGRTMSPLVILNYASTTGFMECQDLRIEESVGADLIVDGAIVATKLAANAIAVGTAAIQNGAIVNAMIANATIDDAKIASLSVSKLTAGSLNVGAFIQSSAYIAGVQGFRLSGDGGFEVRDNTSTRVFNLGASGAQPILKAGSQLEIRADGTAFFAGSLTAATGTFAGALVAATGTFAGNLSAAGGTFAGALTAATGSFSTSTSGKRITLNESGTNEARFYGDRGDGTVELLASIGINAVPSSGGDPIIGYFGSQHPSNGKIAVFAESNFGSAVVGRSVFNVGVNAFSQNTSAVQAISDAGAQGVLARNNGSGAGIRADSASGYAALLIGNLAVGHARMDPLQTRPSGGQPGALAMINFAGGSAGTHTSSPRLCFLDSDNIWKSVDGLAIAPV